MLDDRGLVNTIALSNAFVAPLAYMERNGIHIDIAALDAVEKEFLAEKTALEAEIGLLVATAMGARAYNLASPEQLSQIVYSRKVRDKNKWAEFFNIGSELRGSVRKQKHPRTYPKTIFYKIVNALTTVVFKESVKQCPECVGTRRVAKKRKDGTTGNARYICPTCRGAGMVYETVHQNGKPVVAGFKQLPFMSEDVSAGGFKTDAEQLTKLEQEATGDAKKFLSKVVRYNAVTTYLTNFVDASRKAIRPDGRIHTNFMQHVTATGRLSSQNPNYQNQPRGKTFPIRRIVVSRFAAEGCIAEADLKQLEFRVAAELSQCLVAREAILSGVDVHKDTASRMTENGQPTSRQEAKHHTFKPLYGGTRGSTAEMAYYSWFIEHYKGIGAWHERLLSTAVDTKLLRLPSGREYHFPYARRFQSGTVAGHTQIKNYPVQGFATADIAPASIILLYRKWMEAVAKGLKSLLILTVHDSVVIDCLLSELDQVVELINETQAELPAFLYKLWKFKATLPIEFEIKVGPNWLDLRDYQKMP